MTNSSKKRGFGVVEGANLDIELGEFADSRSPEIANIRAISDQQGVPILDGGVAVPFVISSFDGGKVKRLYGMAFPCLSTNMEVMIGLIIIRKENLNTRQGIALFDKAKKRTEKRVALKFKSFIEKLADLVG